MGWENIWVSKQHSIREGLNEHELFIELKKANGFDVIEGALTYESFLKQHENVKKKLSLLDVKSIFEVGCGSGANLLWFSRYFDVGGIDYSNNLLQLAKEYIPNAALFYGEALNLPTNKNYDVVYSNSVFSYFPNLDYAKKVLNKMYLKANKVIVLLDIHDSQKEEAYYTFRRNNIENYDEVYKGLDKLFYSKNFFIEYAREKGMKIEFENCQMSDYWNRDFVFDCYMYK